MKLLRLLPLLVLFALVGCKDPYGATSKAGADIATGIAQGMNTVSSVAQQGSITPAEALNVLGYLEYANKADEAFLTCIQIAHTNGNKAGTYTACAQAFNSTLNTPAQLALIHVSNTTASQNITVIVNGITAASAAITTALGGS